MQQLRFTAVHEDGQHLVLSSPDGTEMLLAVDERLRAALRPRPAAVDAPATDLRPRHVQALIRAGQSPAEVAEITGWPADRVARFEGPILAEREHVAGMARAAHVRGREPDGTVPTLESRVRERLTARGVDADNTGWDATRPEGGSWTVLVTFVAGQRQRAAAWQFDPADRTVEALDDEARWLSEDEQALPGSAAGKELFGGVGAAEEVDLMTTMREHSRSRGRRKKSPTASADPAAVPSLADAPEQVLPLETLAYDPDSMGLPPAARGESQGRGSGRAARRRSSREGSARKGAARPGQEPEDQDSAEDEQATPTATPPAEQAEAADGAMPYDVEFDFDDDYEVDPSPQEATLADLFGDEVAYQRAGDPSEEHSDEEFEDELDHELGDAPEEADPDEDDPEEDDPEEADPAAGDESSGDGEPATASDATPGSANASDPVVDSTSSSAAKPAPDEDDSDEDDSDKGEPDEADAEVSAEDIASTEDTADAEATDDGPAPARETTKTPRRKDGRPGVPSWDDIMFGAKDRSP